MKYSWERKKRIIRGAVCLGLACSLTAAAITGEPGVFVDNAVIAADDTVVTGTKAAYATDERIESAVVAENDYSNATTTADAWCHYKSSVGVYGRTDPLNANNKVTGYAQTYASCGLLYFGYDYSESGRDKIMGKVEAAAVKAEPDTTYVVEYDYLTQGWPQDDLTVSLTAGGPGTEDFSVTYDVANKVELYKYYGSKSSEDKTKTKDITMSAWSRGNRAVITLPADFDSEAYPYLVFYCAGGGTRDGANPDVIDENGDKRVHVYFDNVKVTKLQTVSEELIAYHSYSSATVRTSGFDSVGQAMGYDAYPTTDPLDRSNKVIRYRQSYGSGFVIIGSGCEGSAKVISEEAIAAEAGKTYHIQFDYYATGTTDSWGTKVQFAVGEGTNNGKLESQGGRQTSYTETILELAKNTDVSTDGWVRNYKASVTVPADADFAKGDKLMLKFTDGGFKTTFYIDNIKVTGDAVKSGVSAVADEELTFNDFSTVTWDAENLWDTDYHETHGNIVPGFDPLDATNRVLRLTKDSTSNHQIILGCDYKSKSYAYTHNIVKNYGDKLITPEPGMSYEIEFDWYAPENPTPNDIIVYAASGPIKHMASSDFGSDYTNCPCYDFQTEILRVGASEKLQNGWQTVKAVVTVPKNTVITDGNVLLLYIRADLNNGSCKLCFDNIKVTKLAQVSVEMNVGSEHSSTIYAQGQDLTGLYPKKDNKAVMWFEDAGYSKPVSLSSLESELPTHITLYGTYEPADKPFVVGDLDGDYLATEADLTTVRKYLTEEIERFDSTQRADANGDGVYDIRDLVHLKKMAAGGEKQEFNINGSTEYTVVVPTADTNYSSKNADLVADYISTTTVNDSAAADNCEIIIGNANREGVTAVTDEDSYNITVEGSKVYVNGGSNRALGAAIVALNGYITAGRSLTDGCIIDFKYIALEHPKDMIGIIPESIYFDDYVTTKTEQITAPGVIESVAATLSLENGSVSDVAKELGTQFATDIKNNKIGDFEKPGDKMVHVSSYAIINNVIYMTYYANDTTSAEDALYQKARFVYAPYDEPTNKTYIDLQAPGDDCYGKTVKAVYDTILMQKDADTLFLLWTANLSGNYYRLYRTYTISTDTLSPVRVNRFKVGEITNDFSITGIKSALTENEIPYKKMYADIGVMQKTSTRVENGETYYYTGAYCGTFTCIIKSKDMITWEYVAQPDFVNYSEWENATYVIGDKCYYFVRQEKVDDNTQKAYGFLTCYDLVEKTWATPVLIEDVQSRSDFIEYNGNLYLFYAPKNGDNIDERQHIGIVKVNQTDLAESEILVHANMGGSCFYPFIQYANGDTTKLYFSYTVWRKNIRFSWFDVSTYLK